jgi:predicted transcriptional regulator
LLNQDKMDPFKQRMVDRSLDRRNDLYKEKNMKRSRDEIITQILGICLKGATKTRIVYQANLNFKTVNPYIDLLAKNGMINIKSGQNRIYMTTDKGSELMECFKAIRKEIEL